MEHLAIPKSLDGNTKGEVKKREEE